MFGSNLLFDHVSIGTPMDIFQMISQRPGSTLLDEVGCRAVPTTSIFLKRLIPSATTMPTSLEKKLKIFLTVRKKFKNFNVFEGMLKKFQSVRSFARGNREEEEKSEKVSSQSKSLG